MGFGKWSWRKLKRKFEFRIDDIKFAILSQRKEKYLITLGVYRIIHYIYFVCLASHRSDLFVYQTKTEEGDLLVTE